MAMASARLSPFLAYLSILSLTLSTVPLGVESKIELALGAGSSILRDALGDVLDKDIDSLGSEDVLHDTAGISDEAMHQRLLEIDAERALLRQRLGLQGSVDKDLQHGHLSEVFNQLSRDLRPLLPQLAWELTVLALAGLLTYFATKQTKWMPTSQKRKDVQSVCQPRTAQRAPVPAKVWNARPKVRSYCNDQQSARLLHCLDGLVKDRMHPKVAAATEFSSPKQLPESSDICGSFLTCSETAMPASMIRPPPGLDLESDITTALPPAEVQENHQSKPEVDSELDLTTDPGPPPGLECAIAESSDSQNPNAGEELSSGMEADEMTAPQAEALLSGNLPDQHSVESSDIRPEEAADDKGLVCDDADAVCEITQLIPSATSETNPKPRAIRRKKLAKVTVDAELPDKGMSDNECEDSVLNPVFDTPPQKRGLPTWFWHCLRDVFGERASLIEDVKPETFSNDAVCRKHADVGTSGSEKHAKRKGKQYRAQAPRHVGEPRCKKASWHIKWPCSLPLTAAIFVMLGIVLAGKIVQSPSLEAQDKELAEKKILLEQLQQQRSGYALRLARLQLKEFQGEAAGVIAELPVDRRSKLQDSQNDAKRLEEALEEVTEAEFPQVEQSFKTVYAGWKKILADARVFQAKVASCEHSESGLQQEP